MEECELGFRWLVARIIGAIWNKVMWCDVELAEWRVRGSGGSGGVQERRLYEVEG